MKTTIATHTPGPWKIDTWHYPDHRGDTLVIQTEEDAISSIHGLYRPDNDAAGKAEEAANARLIAVAPEMYEALTDCLEELWQLHEQIHPECINDRPMRCPSREAINHARETLSKIHAYQTDTTEEHANA